MNSINDFLEIDESLLRKKKVTLYTSPAFMLRGSYLYINSLSVIMDNPFTIKKITFWWEGDRETVRGLGNSMILHISGDFNVVHAMLSFTAQELSSSTHKNLADYFETAHGIKIINSKHITIRKNSSCFRNINGNNLYIGSMASIMFNSGLLIFRTKKDALFASINYTQCKVSEMMLACKRFSKGFFDNPKPKHYDIKNNKVCKINFLYDRFMTTTDKKDILRFKKIIIMSHKVYKQSASEFVKYVKKKRFASKSSEAFSDEELEHITSLFNWQMFKRYTNMLYMYSSYINWDKFKGKDGRDRYFKNMFKKQVVKEKYNNG